VSNVGKVKVSGTYNNHWLHYEHSQTDGKQWRIWSLTSILASGALLMTSGTTPCFSMVFETVDSRRDMMFNIGLLAIIGVTLPKCK